MSDPTPIPRLITLDELAERFRSSPHTIRSWVRQGKLHPVGISRRLLFHPDEVVRFLDSEGQAK